MSRVVRAVVGVVMIAVGLTVPGAQFLILGGAQLIGSALITPKRGTGAESIRPASATTIQLGEVPRQAIFGRAATAGSLVDAFNYGGTYDTDWEVLVLDLADHRCEALEGFYVGDAYVPFAGDGPVAGYNGQLSVWWRHGTEDQTVPDVLLTHGPGWTPDDNGAGVAYVVVAYKADAADAKEPVWPGGRPRFLWIVRGALCYSARADGSVGGMGAHRWVDPTTRQWSENPIDCRYTWARGLYACDRVGDPSQLMIGRGLSAIEAPPANVFPRANLCDEVIGAAPRYRVGAIVEATAKFIDVEQDFAAACAGTISQPQGSVEIDPGEARAAVVTITDDDLVVGTKVSWNNRMLSIASGEWINTVVARYVEPTLKWADHAAPVRRDIADVLADRQPREERVQLGFVTDGAQAGRIAEIRRRMGRLPGRATITLPPRFAYLEEGDWIVWHSPRRFGAQALTFRVDAWGSDAGWRHQLSLRQISASVYSDTAPLDDGAVAILPPPPPAIGAPDAASWAATAGYQAGGDLQSPVLIVEGQSDDRSARFVRVEYRDEAGPPESWSYVGIAGPDIRRWEVPVAALGRYSVAISYVVNGVTGDRLILGPITVGATLYPDGTPVAQLVDRGAYDPTEEYVRGNLVSLPDGSRWRYDAAEPSTGQRPKAGSAHWTMVQGPAAVIPPTTVIGGTLDPITGQPIGGLAASIVIPRIERIPTIETSIAPIPDLAAKVDGLIDAAPSQDAAIAALLGVTADHGAAIATGARAAADAEDTMLALLAMAAEQREILRDAGIDIDPASGKVTIHAIDQLADRLTRATIEVDAVKGQIVSRVTRAELDDAILTAAIDPSQIADLKPLLARMSTAETRLDAQAAAIDLKATVVELAATRARVTSAEQRLDAAEAAIDLRVTRTVFDGLAAEVGDARATLAALPSGLSSISFEVRQARLLADDDEDAQLWDLVRGVEEREARVSQIAEARQEFTARIVEGQVSEAAARQTLAASLGDLDARFVAETVARVEDGKAVTRQLTALGIQSETQATAIGDLRQAVQDGASTSATIRQSIRQVAASADAGDADAEDGMLAALADGWQADATRRAQIAEAFREMSTTLVANESASAIARQALAAQIDAAQASIVSTQKVVSDLGSATARSIDQLRATFDTDIAWLERRFDGQVTRLDQAIADAESASAEAASSVKAELTPLIDAAADAADAVDQRVTGEVQRLDRAIVDGDRASAEAASSVKAELVPLIDAAADAAGAVDQRVTGEVQRLDKAIADGDRASAEAASSVRAELVPLIDAAADAADVVDQRVTGEVQRLDKAIADGDRASAEAASSVRAELVPMIDAAADVADAVDQRVTGEVQRLDKAIADGDRASAEAVETVAARVGDVEATARTQAGAIVDLEGKVLAWLQLEVETGTGRAVVRLAADGHDGSSIDFAANALRFLNPVDGALVTAMRVANGDVEVTRDLMMTDGRLISRSGGYMLVQGKPFGSANQFIEWYGPDKASLAECTEAQAIRYAKTNGQAYNAGIAPEGQLRTQKTTFDLGITSVAIGPAVTNGKPRIYVASLSVEQSGVRTSAYQDGGPITASFLIERLMPSGWQQLGPIGQLGGYSYNGGNGLASPTEPGGFSRSASGTIEITDTSGGTDPIQLRARMTALSWPGVTGETYQADRAVQMLQIVSYEP